MRTDKTFRQIRDFCLLNDTIQLYIERNDLYWNRPNNVSERQRKYFFKEIKPRNVTRIGTFYYCQAQNYLHRFMYGKRVNFDQETRFHIHYKHPDLCNRKLYIISHLSLLGVRIEIDYLFDLGRISYIAMNNLPYTEENVIRSAVSYIEKNYLFPKGVFRNIQLLRNLKKKDALQWYRDFVSPFSKIKYHHYEECYSLDATEKQLLRRLRRKNRIILTNSCDIMRDFITLKEEIHRKPTSVNSRAINITYRDIEDWCDYNGVEVEEDTILQAFNELTS